MRPDDFYESPDTHNIVKTRIVTKYFGAWSDIVLKYGRDARGRIAYVDLFSGPGQFGDGTASTPLWLLDQAVNDPRLSARLVTVFNDRDQNLSARLRDSIEAFPGIERLRYSPKVSNFSVGSDFSGVFQDLQTVPTLFFIDPWGYKGLSLELLRAAIRNWGCDCIFFFNCNRVNQSLHIPSVEAPINEIFGEERANRLRNDLKGALPGERRVAIASALISALGTIGGDYVLPFEFESKHFDRTSHYLIFVSKAKRGYLLMKEVMYGLSTDSRDVKQFGYTPVRSSQLSLLPDFQEPYSIPELKVHLLRECSGKSITLSQVYEDFTLGTPYVMTHVRKAIEELETAEIVSVSTPAAKRRKLNGIVTLAKHHTVTFPTRLDSECP